jgi:hypothetical protein
MVLAVDVVPAVRNFLDFFARHNGSKVPVEERMHSEFHTNTNTTHKPQDQTVKRHIDTPAANLHLSRGSMPQTGPPANHAEAAIHIHTVPTKAGARGDSISNDHHSWHHGDKITQIHSMVHTSTGS